MYAELSSAFPCHYYHVCGSMCLSSGSSTSHQNQVCLCMYVYVCVAAQVTTYDDYNYPPPAPPTVDKGAA